MVLSVIKYLRPDCRLCCKPRCLIVSRLILSRCNRMVWHVRSTSPCLRFYHRAELLAQLMDRFPGRDAREP
jgi:hypothetical protein